MNRWSDVVRLLFEEQILRNKSKYGSSLEYFSPRESEQQRILQDLVVSYIHLLQYDKAETTALEAIELAMKVFGDEDRRYLLSVMNLAAVYTSHGKLSESRDILLPILKIAERTLKYEDEDLLLIKVVFSGAYNTRRERNEMAKLGEEVLETCKRTLAYGYRTKLFAMDELAQTYSCQGRVSDALALNQEALKICIDIFGEVNADSARWMARIATSI